MPAFWQGSEESLRRRLRRALEGIGTVTVWHGGPSVPPPGGRRWLTVGVPMLFTGERWHLEGRTFHQYEVRADVFLWAVECGNVVFLPDEPVPEDAPVTEAELLEEGRDGTLPGWVVEAS